LWNERKGGARTVTFTGQALLASPKTRARKSLSHSGSLGGLFVYGERRFGASYASDSMKKKLLLLGPALLSAVVLGCGNSSEGANTGDGAGGRPSASGSTGSGGNGATGGSGNTGGSGGNGGSAIPPITITDAAVRDGAWGDGAGLCGTTLVGTVRDVQDSHPDFEKFTNVTDKGIVAPVLGADQKPVYAGNPRTPSTTGKDNFDAWYHDVTGVNMALPVSVPLTPSGQGTYTFNNDAFFPIDNQGFGNQGRNHNFHFTAEIHTRFIYRGGEVFNFKGDDDIFVFINQRLVINLGGVHEAQTEQVNLDARAAEIGLVKEGIYALDLFFAERHTVESHIRIDTTIGSFVDCGTPPPPK
jgi:fibro-slime domain-containing protein